jgi:hypothetical protein
MNIRSFSATALHPHAGSQSSRLFGKSIVLGALLWMACDQTLAQNTNGTEPNVIPFDIARMIIEFNATDQDVGVQVLLDAEPYKQLNAFRPDGQQILDITATSSLQEQGLTELFFESSEPSLAEVPLKEFLARFPEGAYKFEGETIDGIELEGEALFTHVIPAAPVVIVPEEDAVTDPNNTVILWEPVTESIAGSTDIDIIGYQVIVSTEDPRRLAGVRVFNADVPSSVTSVTVSPEFLEPDTEYEFEVLAIEAGGNQTIAASSFTTAP